MAALACYAKLRTPLATAHRGLTQALDSSGETMTRRKIPVLYWLVPVFVLVTFAANYLLLRDHPDKGIMGDLFGASNAIFTGLALCAAAIAVHLQSVELAETRAELG